MFTAIIHPTVENLPSNYKCTALFVVHEKLICVLRMTQCICSYTVNMLGTLQFQTTYVQMYYILYCIRGMDSKTHRPNISCVYFIVHSLQSVLQA